jgi:NADP-reducing hydrogenase subunit HndB
MNLEELRKIREKAEKDIELRQKKTRIKVVVGMGTSGIASGAREVLKTFVEEIGKHNLTDVVVTQTGEKGLASQEPLIEVFEEGRPAVVYGSIDAAKARRIVEEHLVGNRPVMEYVIEAM